MLIGIGCKSRRWRKSCFAMDAAQRVQPGQAFCSRCGKQIVGPVTAMQQRRRAGARGTFICWGFSGSPSPRSTPSAAVILYVLANTLFAHLHEMGAPEAPTAIPASAAECAQHFHPGQGGLRIHCWLGTDAARALGPRVALVLGFISLFNVPFGTAVGVYTLWVLLPAQSQEEYDALAAARAA